MEDELFGSQPLNPQQATTLREMARKAQDRIRVYNPTDADYTIRWDGIGFVVPARLKDNGNGGGQSILPRYIAQNYVKHMTDKILGEKMITAIKSENLRRQGTGQASMNQWEERIQFDTQFRIDNPDARRMVLEILWLGIEEEYGMEDPVREQDQAYDPRPVDEQILATMDRPARRLDPATTPTAESMIEQAPIRNATQAQASVLDAPEVATDIPVPDPVIIAKDDLVNEVAQA